MNAVEKVQQAAVALLATIREAQAGGYVVQWPSRPENLPAIAVSATAAVADPAPVATLAVEPDAPAAIAGEGLPVETVAAKVSRRSPK